MPEKKIRVGFVGGGRIADLQCLGWMQHPRGEIHSVFDPDEATLDQRARDWDAKPCKTLEDLLADESLDAVEIVSPHHLHIDQAIAALEAGKHVSLQKPPATSLEEYDRLYPVVAASEKQFRVFENFMWYPPHVLAKRLVEEGEIGDVLSVRLLTASGKQGTEQGWYISPSSTKWRLDPALAGAGWATFDHGFHCFQMGRFFVDDDVETVHAFINHRDLPGGGVIDIPALISWKYKGPPRLGSWEVIPSFGLEVRSKYYVSDDRMEIRGSNGVIWANQCQGRLLEEAPLVVYSEGVERAYHSIETDWSASFIEGTVDFIEAIIEGRASPLEIDEARKTLAFALAAQISARENREVRLDEPALTRSEGPA